MSTLRISFITVNTHYYHYQCQYRYYSALVMLFIPILYLQHQHQDAREGRLRRIMLGDASQNNLETFAGSCLHIVKSCICVCGKLG